MNAAIRPFGWLVLLASCAGQPAYTERTVDGRAEVEVTAIPVASETDTVRATPRIDPDDPATFPRDQPVVRGMQRWNGRIVVQADAYYALDLSTGESRPLTIPGADEVLGLAMQGPTAVALVRRGTERVLLVAQAERWVERPLPEAIRASTAPLALAADSTTIALFTDGRLHRLRGTTWTSVAVPPTPRVVGGAMHVLLSGDLLFAGWDDGEHGGELLVFDARTGQWSIGPGGGTPVHDLDRAPDGTVWAATGLARFGGLHGALRKYEDGAWTTVASCGYADPSANQGWNLPAESMQSITFAPDGSLEVLTGTLGVVRRDPSGTFHQRTREWPQARYLYVQALELDGDVAVIASKDAGVWVWDLREGGIERIPLRRASGAAATTSVP